MSQQVETHMFVITSLTAEPVQGHRKQILPAHPGVTCQSLRAVTRRTRLITFLSLSEVQLLLAPFHFVIPIVVPLDLFLIPQDAPQPLCS